MAIHNFLFDQLNAIFDECGKIKIYKDGKTKFIEKDSPEFNEIIRQWEIDCNGGYEMPAYYVSLHNETVEEMKSGLFVEFLFDETMHHNEMPFDSLVLKLGQNQYGYTLIRHHDGLYEGRCYHLQRLEPNNELYNIVVNASKDMD